MKHSREAQIVLERLEGAGVTITEDVCEAVRAAMKRVRAEKYSERMAQKQKANRSAIPADQLAKED